MDEIALIAIQAAPWLTPVLVSICWWLWFNRGGPPGKTWRVSVLLVGLIATSSNAVLYYAWLSYSQVVYRTSPGSLDPGIMRNSLGNNLAVPLVMVALGAAIIGRGAARARGLPYLRLQGSCFGSESAFCNGDGTHLSL
jgi:hypothetical protein